VIANTRSAVADENQPSDVAKSFDEDPDVMISVRQVRQGNTSCAMTRFVYEYEPMEALTSPNPDPNTHRCR
jgi:hypothetical protein